MSARDSSPPPAWSAYDEMGDRYRLHAEDSPYNAHYDRPAVLSELGPVAGLRVLDAACGPGIYAAALLASGAEVVGFDASEAMVGLARDRVGERARIDHAALGTSLPYPDASFDAGICALAIHYVADLRAAFSELYRVLRTGARFVVSTQHPMVDWIRLGGSYFEPTLETDVWTLNTGLEQIVQFWRVPLSDLCTAATDAGFVIDRLVEPRPAESMQDRYPRDHAKLSREPWFLILRLRKI